jgi:hypothetical protein
VNPEKRRRRPVWPQVRFFICRKKEGFDMLAKEYPEVTKVVGTLKKLS